MLEDVPIRLLILLLCGCEAATGADWYCPCSDSIGLSETKAMGSDGGSMGGLEGVGVGWLFCDTVTCCCFSLILLACDDAVGTVGVGGSSTGCCCSSFCKILEDVELLSFDRCDSLSFFFFLRNPRAGIRNIAGRNAREGKSYRPSPVLFKPFVYFGVSV